MAPNHPLQTRFVSQFGKTLAECEMPFSCTASIGPFRVRLSSFLSRSRRTTGQTKAAASSKEGTDNHKHKPESASRLKSASTVITVSDIKPDTTEHESSSWSICVTICVTFVSHSISRDYKTTNRLQIKNSVFKTWTWNMTFILYCIIISWVLVWPYCMGL